MNRYTFNKVENLQDSGYREEIIYEINTNASELNLSGKELQETKMFFGQFCYLKGATEHYKVEDGTLLLKALNLNSKITEVPKIKTEINRIFK